jgi:hypothetical protein
MRLLKHILPLALVATAVMAGTPAASIAKGPHFEGTVLSVNRAAKTFRLRDPERGTVRIKVTPATKYQRIAGFSAIKKGVSVIDAKVTKKNGVWVAWKIERN